VKIGAPHIIGAIFALALVAALGLALMETAPIDLLVYRDAELTQMALGRSVYATRCASCHGKNLEGQPNMPAFGGQLTGEEIDSVVAYIKSTWPERERQYQERINGQNQQQQ